MSCLPPYLKFDTEVDRNKKKNAKMEVIYFSSSRVSSACLMKQVCRRLTRRPDENILSVRIRML